MRERCPVARSDFMGWSLLRHQEIVAVLADPETYSSATEFRAVPNGLDPPEHDRYRRVLEPYFRPEAMAALEPRCRRIAVGLMPALLADDGAEFIAEFAQPFSLKALCTFLGWPAAIWDDLRRWTRRNQEAAFSQNGQEGAALADEYAGFVTEALRVRRDAGAALAIDVTAGLMGTTVDGTALSDQDIVAVLRNWTAGHATVVAALGNLVFSLAEQPDMQQRLRCQPALLPAAIDEMLRVDGPLVANVRTTTREVAIGGQKIDAGAKLSLNWIAANRDGRQFDEPDAVRLDRDPSANLLFGGGIHECQGAPLARLEMRVALEVLLAGTNAIALDTTTPPSRDAYPSNGFRTLPVRLS